MRVLAHVHTFNDADVVDQTIDRIRRQTRAVDEILIVDNASTDGTLERPSVKHATVLRHAVNKGTSGAVYTGFRYALDREYDWIWVFDADSAPEPDALEKLLDLYAGQAFDEQQAVAFIACLPRDSRDGTPLHGNLFTRRGFAGVNPASETGAYRCHSTIWSGSLYSLAAARQVGLPNPDYVLDCGEGEYGYRLMKAGYAGFIHQNAVLDHNVRGSLSANQIEARLGPVTVTVFEFPPIRCYYVCRNVVYFALYDFAEERFRYLRSVSWWIYGFPLRFLVSPRRHRKQIVACVRGLWHGFTGNITARY